MTESTRTVERCLRVAAPRPAVFHALLDPAALSRWMYATVRWKPQQGASYRIDWQDTSLPAHAQGEILEIEDDRRLVLSWFMEKLGCETVASFELDDDEAGQTLVKFRHRGFPGGPEWQSRFDMVSLEWDKVLENLRFHVEEGGEQGTPFYLRIQTALPASRERAHLYWVAPGAIATWLAKEAFTDPAAGGEMHLTLMDGSEVHGLIRTFAPGKHMRILWEEGGRKSLIGLSFWAEGEGCVVTLTHRSYAIPEEEKEAVRALWEIRLAKLAEVLGRAPGRWSSGGSRGIVVERIVKAPIDRVWKAWTDPVSLIGWFCDRAEFTLREGHAYSLLWTAFGEQRGRIREVEPGRRLGFSWDLPAVEATTDAEILLAPVEGDPSRVRVRLNHTGWGVGDAWDREYRGAAAGWRSVLSMLEFHLDHGHRGVRRSFILRRALHLAPSDVWKRLTSEAGLKGWLGESASIDLREGGAIRVALRDGSTLEGIISMAEPSEGIAFSFASPEASYLELGWSPSHGGTRILATGFTHGANESWPLLQRIQWSDRLERLGGGA